MRRYREESILINAKGSGDQICDERAAFSLLLSLLLLQIGSGSKSWHSRENLLINCGYMMPSNPILSIVM